MRAQFKAFADRWESVHTTSSPRFPQSNGGAENAIESAERLMTKANESGSDPLLALLDWKNTPSEQLGASPAQLMFVDEPTRVCRPRKFCYQLPVPRVLRLVDHVKAASSVVLQSHGEGATHPAGGSDGTSDDSEGRKAEVA